jgi:hypothetical protein
MGRERLWRFHASRISLTTGLAASKSLRGSNGMRHHHVSCLVQPDALYGDEYEQPHCVERWCHRGLGARRQGLRSRLHVSLPV